MIEETIGWRPVEVPPLDDRTVLLFMPGRPDPVWPGFYWANKGGWHYADGSQIHLRLPTHWAEMPTGPEVTP